MKCETIDLWINFRMLTLNKEWMNIHCKLIWMNEWMNMNELNEWIWMNWMNEYEWIEWMNEWLCPSMNDWLIECMIYLSQILLISAIERSISIFLSLGALFICILLCVYI